MYTYIINLSICNAFFYPIDFSDYKQIHWYINPTRFLDSNLTFKQRLRPSMATVARDHDDQQQIRTKHNLEKEYNLPTIITIEEDPSTRIEVLIDKTHQNTHFFNNTL